MSLQYIVPFVAGFSNEKNLNGQKLRYCQVRFLCEGGVHLWQENVPVNNIIETIKDSGLEVDKVLQPINNMLLLQIKPTSTMNTIETWTPNGNFNYELLYWRSFNFIIQSSDYSGKFQYHTPIPDSLSIKPLGVNMLINTVLKVCLDIDIE